MTIVICKHCNKEITNPDFRKLFYDEEFPDIMIGPYCENCIRLHTVCSHCHKAFYFDKMKRIKDDVLCPECLSHVDICSCCGGLLW